MIDMRIISICIFYFSLFPVGVGPLIHIEMEVFLMLPNGIGSPLDCICRRFLGLWWHLPHGMVPWTLLPRAGTDRASSYGKYQEVAAVP